MVKPQNYFCGFLRSVTKKREFCNNFVIIVHTFCVNCTIITLYIKIIIFKMLIENCSVT